MNNIKIRYQKITSKKYNCNENYFKNINTENKAYWLGFIFADGYISKTKYSDYFGITLGMQDKEHLEKLKIDLNCDYPLKKYIGSGYSQNNEYIRLLISSTKLVENLEKHGVVEQKTKKLSFPQISKKYYLPFIRGFMDGDGSIYISKRDKNLGVHIGGTLDMLLVIQNYFNLLGIEQKIMKNRSIFDLHYTGKKAIKILDLIYKNASIYLDRKYKIFTNYINIQ